MKYFKSFSKLIINFSSTLVSVIKVIIYSKFVVKIKNIKSENTKCHILGNGPSLKDNLLNDLDLLKSEELFVVNDFANSEFYELLKPKYYVLADPVFWDQGIYQDFHDEGVLVLDSILNKTTWPMYLIIPNEAYKKKIFQTKILTRKMSSQLLHVALLFYVKLNFHKSTLDENKLHYLKY